MFDVKFLFASLIWGAVGGGYWIYGKRQQSMAPLFGGMAMIGVSYFVSSALLMSLICVGIMIGVYFLVKQGY